MSYTNIIPAWVLTADSVINQYHEGRLDLERAEAKLTSLCVPQSMMNRLYDKPKEEYGNDI
ncbi:MAG: hypothetical protein GY820_22080 [Gammaproteobacteria bacterium]|nr:hypothetical protein [Gammaproteobacteria bacterium]